MHKKGTKSKKVWYLCGMVSEICNSNKSTVIFEDIFLIHAKNLEKAYSKAENHPFTKQESFSGFSFLIPIIDQIADGSLISTEDFIDKKPCCYPKVLTKYEILSCGQLAD